MPKKQKNIKSRSNSALGKEAKKRETEKKSDFYHLHKNTIWTIAVLIILTIFFVINNTRKIPEQGSYPPNYNGVNSSNDSGNP